MRAEFADGTFSKIGSHQIVGSKAVERDDTQRLRVQSVYFII
jgi:hypothetical protein